ncbi:MAG: cation-translocating P-type ATPase, partial [Clostridia bacterium]|nr:cation-translocating P-type ATPase [Clostridia bacterium]
VPGDIIYIQAGDLVPADCRIIESYKLETEESSLTGESHSIEKSSEINLKENTPISEQKNMIFSGSTIISGRAKCVVVSTGMQTEVGRIATLLDNEDPPQTPLQKKLQQTSKILGLGITAICFVILILGIYQGVPFIEMFMIAISLAVAAIPEGLPAIVTIVLAMGIRKLAKNKAIVRKLPAVETLGNASVICSDKTGTLTQNKMTVKKISNEDAYLNLSSKEAVKILELASLCNNAKESDVAKKEGREISGEATEKAILEAFKKTGGSKISLEEKYERVQEFPFSSERKLMTTVHKLSSKSFRVITKGAPDYILKKIIKTAKRPLTAEIKGKIISKNNAMSSGALRVIAVAYKDVSKIPETVEEAEKDLIFCGLIGMYDPPREEVKYAVESCKKAGIKPVMVTGDHINTAKAIAKETGIYKEGKDSAITGVELDKMNVYEFEKNIVNYSVFARVTPEHKVKIVKAYQKRGEIVAMTVDGVNDAPALKSADIGCAMGKSGTDVAKSAADIVLTDDNFSTIVKAVKEGRAISQNIKRSIHFLLSSNFGEIVAIFIAFLLNIPSPLLAIQLLWLNVVTDSFPALALGVTPIEEDIMKIMPQKGKTELFDARKWKNIALEGSYIGAISILAFSIGRVFFDTTAIPAIGRTMAFAVLSLSQIVHAFNVQSEKSIFRVGFFHNINLVLAFVVCTILQVSVIAIPFLSAIFKTVSLNFFQWLIVWILSFSPLILVEIEKTLEN